MATFDQRDENVTNQYNAAGDIHLYAQVTPYPTLARIVAALASPKVPITSVVLTIAGLIVIYAAPPDHSHTRLVVGTIGFPLLFVYLFFRFGLREIPEGQRSIVIIVVLALLIVFMSLQTYAAVQLAIEILAHPREAPESPKSVQKPTPKLLVPSAPDPTRSRPLEESPFAPLPDVIEKPSILPRPDPPRSQHPKASPPPTPQKPPEETAQKRKIDNPSKLPSGPRSHSLCSGTLSGTNSGWQAAILQYAYYPPAISNRQMHSHVEYTLENIKNTICPPSFCDWIFVEPLRLGNPLLMVSSDLMMPRQPVTHISYSPSIFSLVENAGVHIMTIDIMLAHSVGHHLDMLDRRSGRNLLTTANKLSNAELRADAWAGCAFAPAEGMVDQASSILASFEADPRAAAARKAAFLDGYTECSLTPRR